MPRRLLSKPMSANANSYARGVIKILDLRKLKMISCECDQSLRTDMQ